ncbi:hypothetical protein ETAA8_62700 [Anatilimnocola aggregata]|uniref:GYF domain-containing protein n=1 Tax=Anatilimnocola aggregata TaxID=2528021 RepID=A0A517YLK9_9BACT|nr:hypothetical protein [Anatilimnocola aggregata]QDU31117.1 hypothetical protein ETAA8_62700 [Anatilimnocola aggregata]
MAEPDLANEQREWYYRDFGRGSPVQGPFFLSELVERVQTGELQHDALVRRSEEEWLQADRLQVLIKAIRERRPREAEQGAGESPIHIPAELAAQIRSERRSLNWLSLFILGIVLSIAATLLIVTGVLAVFGLVLSVISSAMVLCAIIRWAIEPLFGQLVDTNDQLATITSRLKELNRSPSEGP